MRLKNGDVLFIWPLALHVITAGWTYNNGSAHNAIDLLATVGEPVYCIAPEGVACVWNPDTYPAYWQEVI